MRNRDTLIFSVFAVVLAGLIVSASAQDSNDMRHMSNRGANGMMFGDRMQGGMMSRGMMSGGCMGMMESMNGTGAPPNSHWQKSAPSVPN